MQNLLQNSKIGNIHSFSSGIFGRDKPYNTRNRSQEVIVLSLPRLTYPNKDYQKVLTKVTEYFKTYPGVYAMVLTGSLARGKAVEGSCIDLFIFLGKRQFDTLASTLKSRAKAYSSLGGRICYYGVQWKVEYFSETSEST